VVIVHNGFIPQKGAYGFDGRLEGLEEQVEVPWLDKLRQNNNRQR